MKILFNVEYQTTFGESLVLNILPGEDGGKLSQHKMTTLDGCHWFVEVTKNPKPSTFIDYYYSLMHGDEEARHEWLVEPHRLEFAAQKAARYTIYDHWIDIPEDAYMYSSALTDCIMVNQREMSTPTEYQRTVRLKVRAPQIRIGEQLAIVGAGDALGNWDVNKALPMFEHEYHEWVISLDADKLPQTFEFKFVMLGIDQPVWEQGGNRSIALTSIGANEVVVYELSQVYLPVYPWKGAGTVIPIFSLRSEGSFGVGDFGDLKKMIDWVDKTNQRILQVLPINDTNMTGSWQDSYPYNSISIYALHPQYTDFRQLPEIKDEAKRAEFEALRLELNALPQIDYERMFKAKMDYLKVLFEQEWKHVKATKAYKQFYEDNRQWLVPYAEFCVNRDKYGTADFNQWPKETKKQKLKADSSQILKMIELCGKWKPEEDQKLNQLEILLNKTHRNEKVVVFTQYSDTANYIYHQLKERGIKSIECVTGNSDNQVELVNRFSPVSNNAPIVADNELRVLIATDVLSEGQNLQDAHIVVNFDLPWAIIRLIQRAGRVDRIGQEAENIDCYSFFPAEGVENIINLRNRLNQRINENANVMGSDELFFEGNEQNLRDIYNEKSGVLDDEEDTDVDLTSYAYQIWTEATKANPELKSRILKLGNMVDSTKETSDAMEEGVVTYARTKSGYDVLSWVDKEGKVVCNSQKRILRAMSCAANTPSIPHHENHYELIKDAIKNIQETSVSQVSGTLGNRFSTRFKIYDLLDNYYNTKEADLFFTEDKRQQLKIAIDTIFNGQLLEQTKFMLGRMMRSRVSNDEIVDYVLELLRTGNLCKVEEDQLQSNTPSIICSMGIRKQD